MNKTMQLAAVMTFAVLSGALCAQQYSVTVADVSYTPLTGGTDLTLGDDDISSVISPTGFSFTYFGATYTSFRVGSNGYIIMGANGSTTSPTPDHGAAPGAAIAPFWADLMPHTGTSTRVAWDYTGGNLIVTWENVIQRVSTPTIGTHKVLMNLVLDTATGAIHFQYGQPTGATITFGAFSSEDYTVAISSSIIQAQTIIVGEIRGYVDADGKVTDYPADKQISFIPPATAPTFTSAPVTDAEVGTQYTYTLLASANPAATFSAASLPAWLSLNGDILEGTPGAGDTGNTGNITLTATNTHGSDTQTFSIDVTPAPEAPTIASTPPDTALVGSAYSHQVVATGYPAPTFSITGEPAWLSLSGDMLQGTPQAGDVGVTGTITLTATNAHGSDSVSFTIDVSTQQQAPAITSTALTAAAVGQLYSYSVTATGNPPPAITFGGLPGWLAQTGNTISGVPDHADAGTSGPITVTAANGSGSDVQTFSIVVQSQSASNGGGGGGSGGCVAVPGASVIWLLWLPALLARRRR